MFRCGLDLDYGLEVNRAHDIRRIVAPASFKPWPEPARDAFEAAAAAGACPRWVWTGYMFGLWTPLRLENVLALSRPISTAWNCSSGNPMPSSMARNVAA